MGVRISVWVISTDLVVKGRFMVRVELRVEVIIVKWRLVSRVRLGSESSTGGGQMSHIWRVRGAYRSDVGDVRHADCPS